MPPKNRAKKQKAPVLSIKHDTKYMGHEPENLDLSDNVKVIKTLTWYSYFGDRNMALEYANDHYKKLGNTTVVNQLNRIGERGMSFIPQMGWICRLIDRGCIVPDDMILKLDDYLDEMARIDERLAQLKTLEPIRRVQKVTPAEDLMIRDIEELLYGGDKPQKIPLRTIAEARNANARSVEAVRAHFKPLLDELNEAAEINFTKAKKELQEISALRVKIDTDLEAGKNPSRTQKKLEEYDDRKLQLFEAYSGVGIAVVKMMQQVLSDAFEAAQQEISAAKQARVSNRKPKTVTADKQTKDMKYQDRDDELLLVSRHPKEAVGKTRIWVYNTRYKKIGYWEFADGASASGSTFKGFTFGKSKTVRKPKDFFNDFRQTTPKRRMKMYEDLKTAEQDYPSRMNENTLIVGIE